jgi:hypothetical protein
VLLLLTEVITKCPSEILLLVRKELFTVYVTSDLETPDVTIAYSPATEKKTYCLTSLIPNELSEIILI